MSIITAVTKSGGNDVTAIQNNALLADIATLGGDYNTTAGTQPTYTISINAVIVTLEEGLKIKVKIHSTNTDTSTINVNTLGATGIRKQEGRGLVELAGGELVQNNIYEFLYNGTYFVVLNPSDGAKTVTAGTTLIAGGKYISNGTTFLTHTLPSTANIGDTITISGIGTYGFKIAQPASHSIIFDAFASTAGTSGFLLASGRYSQVTLRYVASNTWVVDTASRGVAVDTALGAHDPLVLGIYEQSDTIVFGVTDDALLVPYSDTSGAIALSIAGISIDIQYAPSFYRSGNAQRIAPTSLLAASSSVGRPIVFQEKIFASAHAGATRNIYVASKYADISSSGNWTLCTVSGRSIAANEGIIGFCQGHIITADGSGFYRYTYDGTSTLTYVDTVTVTSSSYTTGSIANNQGILSLFGSSPCYKLANMSGTLLGGQVDMDNTVTRQVSACAGSFYGRVQTERSVTTDSVLMIKIL